MEESAWADVLRLQVGALARLAGARDSATSQSSFRLEPRAERSASAPLTLAAVPFFVLEIGGASCSGVHRRIKHKILIFCSREKNLRFSVQYNHSI